MILRVKPNLSTYAVNWTHSNTAVINFSTLSFTINGVNIYNGTGAAYADITAPIDCGLSTLGNAITLQSLTLENSFWFTFRIDGLTPLDSTTFEITLAVAGTHDAIVRSIANNNEITIYGYDLGNNPSATPTITLNNEFQFYLVANGSTGQALSKFIRVRNPNYTSPNGTHELYAATSNDTYVYDTVSYTDGVTTIATLDGHIHTQLPVTFTMATAVGATNNSSNHTYGSGTTQRWYVDDVKNGFNPNGDYFIFENTTCNTFQFISMTFLDKVTGGGNATTTLYQFDGLTGGTAIWTMVGAAATTPSGYIYAMTLTDDGIYKLVFTSIDPEDSKNNITYTLIFLAKCNTEACLLSKLPDLICCKAIDTCHEADYYQFNSMAMTAALAGIYFYKMNQLAIAGTLTTTITDAWIYRLQDIIDRIATYCTDCNSPCNCSNNCNCIGEQTRCF